MHFVLTTKKCRSLQVQEEAETLVQGIFNLKDIAEAALQSGRQARQTRVALRKALADEEAEKEKEAKRMEKEAAAQAKKDEAARKKEEAKAKKKEELAKKKAEEKEAAAAAGGDKRRRGKGMDELAEGDPPILRQRWPEREVPIVDCIEEFLNNIARGLPTIWRARRPPMKKVLDTANPGEDKQNSKGVLLLRAEHKTFHGHFAELVAEGSTTRQPQFASEHAQPHLPALSFDGPISKVLEAQAAEPTLGLDPSVVLDREIMTEFLKEAVEALDCPTEINKQKAEGEAAMYNTLHHVGIKHGHKFAGVMQGLWGNLTYQMEGARVISLAALDDVA